MTERRYSPDGGEAALLRAMPVLSSWDLTRRLRFVRKCADGALASEQTKRDLADEFGTTLAVVNRVTSSDIFRAALLTELKLAIDLRGAPAAVNYCIELVQDTAAQHKDRLAAAKILLDRSELSQISELDRSDQDPSEMTVDQLKRAISDMESTLAERATPVNAPSEDGDAYDAALNALNSKA